MGNVVSIRNAQIFQKNDGINTQPREIEVVANNSVLPLENEQQVSLTANSNGVSHDKNCDNELLQETLSKEQKHENSHANNGELKLADKSNILIPTSIENELIIVIENSYNEVIKSMVNSTTQHPKTRNPTNTTVATSSNNSSVSTRDSVIVKEHITNESIMVMTSKSPLSTVTPVIEVIYDFIYSTYLKTNNFDLPLKNCVIKKCLILFPPPIFYLMTKLFYNLNILMLKEEPTHH